MMLLTGEELSPVTNQAIAAKEERNEVQERSQQKELLKEKMYLKRADKSVICLAICLINMI